MFTGFHEDLVDFMWGIRFNNERSWFEPRKEYYQKNWYEPMKELGNELCGHLMEKRPKYEWLCKVSRIYRDARRLFGRGPYKDHLWFSIGRPAGVWDDRPDFWFEIDPEGYSYGLGYWMPKPATMAKLRMRIDRDPAAMEKLMRRLGRQSVLSLETQTYKRPRSTPPSPLVAPWYSAKGFSIGFEGALSEELYSRQIVERLREGYDYLLPFYDYFLTLSSDPEPGTL